MYHIYHCLSKIHYLSGGLNNNKFNLEIYNKIIRKFRYNEMESKLKKIMYLVISLLIALLLNNTLIFKQETQIDYSIPPQSAGYIESFIYVDGNWTETASTYDWCYGDGTHGVHPL